MNIDKKALKGVVDEIEASRARQKGETEFQREALKRAVKNHQLDAKAIRIVLQRRAMGETKRDEQDYYVHSYEVALGGKKAAVEALEAGASVREAAKAGGISTGAAGNLAKAVQKSSFVDGETISTTGSAHEGDDDGRQHRQDGQPDDRLGGEADAPRPEGPTLGLERQGHVAGAADAGCEQQDDAALCLHPDGGRDRRPGALAVQPDGPPGDGLGAGGVAGPQDLSSPKAPEEDDLKFPVFLTKAGQRAPLPKE